MTFARAASATVPATYSTFVQHYTAETHAVAPNAARAVATTDVAVVNDRSRVDDAIATTTAATAHRP